jgi:hypothetical protein
MKKSAEPKKRRILGMPVVISNEMKDGQFMIATISHVLRVGPDGEIIIETCLRPQGTVFYS